MQIFRRSLIVPMALLSGLGLLLVAALMPISDRLTANVVVQRCFDALHLPLFALAAAGVTWFSLTRLLRKREGSGNGGRVAWLVAVIFVGIAGLVEVIQPFAGRSSSVWDFLYGALGAVIGVWWVARSKLWGGRESSGFWLLALVSVTAVGWPMVVAGQHSRQLAKSFPQLLVGDAGVDGAFWKSEAGAEIEFLPSGSTDGGRLYFHAVTQPNEWSGVHFRPSSAAADWSDRQHLVLQLSTNDEKPFTLGLKIEDFDSSDHSTRFNYSIPLTRGRHEVRIALGEISPQVVDLRRVKRLAFFVSAGKSARSFVVEQAFLE